MTHILFISKEKQNPTTRYRVLPLMHALQSREVNVKHMDSDVGLYGKLHLLLSARRADAVFIQRKLYGKLFTQLLKRCFAQMKILSAFPIGVRIRSGNFWTIKRTSGGLFPNWMTILSILLDISYSSPALYRRWKRARRKRARLIPVRFGILLKMTTETRSRVNLVFTAKRI